MVKNLMIRVTVLTKYRCVTDRQTDRQTNGETDIQTSCDGTVRIMHTRRAVKITIIQQRLTKRRSTVLIRDVV